MNGELPFPHHNYLNEPNEGNFELVSSSDAVAVDNPGPEDVPGLPVTLRKARVARIILVHGTFAGNDVIGLVREVARLSPRVAVTLKLLGKRVFDQLAGELGNYTQAFAEECRTLVNEVDPHTTPNRDAAMHSVAVSRFNWSGENHHLGRAAGAVALLHEILTSDHTVDDRILIWGHSHGGNLLAMMCQLVGASADSQKAFFEATRTHYHNPILRSLDLPMWEEVRELLHEATRKRTLPQLDIATFGTPLRYRWNQSVCPKLLHFVQHRVLDPEHPTVAKFPGSIRDVIRAHGGDYIQQFGISGSDFYPQLYSWRSWQAERRLRRMFEASARRRDVTKNLRKGHRVSLDGTTLLVDYPTTEQKWNQKLIGHGVYTRHEWLPFHLNAIAKRFYSRAGD